MPKQYSGQEAVEKYYDNFYLPEHRQYLTKERTAAEVAWLMQHIGSKPETVCDVGCGAGQHLLAFAQAGVPQGYGFDLSAVLIKQAQKELKPCAGYKVERADFTDWKPEPGAYDVVYSLFSSFSYCLNDNDAQELINKMVRATKSGGLICVDVDNVFRLVRILEGRALRVMETDDEVAFNATTMILAAEEKRDGMVLKTNTRYFVAADFVRWLAKAGIYRKDISFFGDLSDKPYSYMTQRLVVVAKKNGRQ